MYRVVPFKSFLFRHDHHTIIVSSYHTSSFLSPLPPRRRRRRPPTPALTPPVALPAFTSFRLWSCPTKGNVHVSMARIIVSRWCLHESPWLEVPCEGTKYTDCLEWRIERARTVAASCGKNGRDLPTPCSTVSQLFNVAVTGRWRVSRTATVDTSSIRSHGHELGKTTNLAHAPNYAWTMRSILCALLLPVLAAATHHDYAFLSFVYLFLSHSSPFLLSPFLFYHLLLPLSSSCFNYYFSLNTTTENMAYLCFQDEHMNRNTLDVFCCLGSCLLHHYIPPSLASLFLDTFGLSLDHNK